MIARLSSVSLGPSRKIGLMRKMEPEINLAPSFKVVSGGECYGGVLIAFFDQELLEGGDQQDGEQNCG